MTAEDQGPGPGTDRDRLQGSRRLTVQSHCTWLLPRAGGNSDKEARGVEKSPFILYLNSSDLIKIHTWVCFCSPYVIFFLYTSLSAPEQPLPTWISKARAAQLQQQRRADQCQLQHFPSSCPLFSLFQSCYLVLVSPSLAVIW